ncbi:MAG: hypothetical protein DMG74_09665 [Acidobacteria bacterium]|nr:MAG: hypothetical protein DMG74_09665 [Acidobacteriota bacterium]
MMAIVGWSTGAGLQLWPALAITTAFAILAWLIKGVNRSGTVAGAVVSFLLLRSAGLGAFAVLVSVFALTWISTRFGYARKLHRGTAEKSNGRNGFQVLANLGIATSCVALFAITDRQVFLLACVAALAEAAADTVSSEYGQATSDTALLITTLERVPAGTDGGISMGGTVAGIIAAIVVSFVALVAGLLAWRWLWVSATAAVVGMLADSLLGASLERKHVLGNDAVNLLGTLISALLAAGLFMFLNQVF